MKKIILPAMLALLCNVAFAQHVIYLKNGDRLRGKVTGGKQDTLLFDFMGNSLKLSIQDMEAVYFNDELAPTDIYNQPNPKNSKLRGMVSYYLNSRNSTLPDNGSRVWVVDSAAVSDFNIAVVDTFLFAIAYREIKEQYDLSQTPVPADVQAQLRILKADDDERFDALARRASKHLYMLKSSPSAAKAVADKNGYFMMNLAPGTYYALIVSSNNQGGNIVEIEGKVFCKKIKAFKDEETTLKHSFEIF